MSAFVFLATTLFARSAAASTVVRAGFASIANDPDAGTWTITSSGTSLVLALDAQHDLAILDLSSFSNTPWALGATPDTFLKIGGQTLPLGNRGAGFVYQNVSASAKGMTVRLDATFDLPAARLRVTRHYVATSGSTAFETWTSVEPLGPAVTLADLNALRLTIPAGAIHWINGLQGDVPDQPRDTAFTLQQRSLSAGERLTLGAAGRSSEETVPWIRVDGGAEQFFAGLLWSGAWSLTAVRSSAGIELTAGLRSMTTTTSTILEGPHAFFGVVRGGASAVSTTLRSFVIQGLRGGRRLDALVTYNTWFAYGVEMDDATMRAEMEGAARLGAELFVLDAGWYLGAGRDGADDFSSGLGTWQVDASRFPNGLNALADYAHSLGLKFGIWVEPERVALSTVDQRGLAQEGWLAKAGGKPGSSEAAQICLSSGAARQWIFDQLVRLIDEVQPDYLKWDNNFWINCDRSGHGHGAMDGNFAHVTGLYRVLADLRSRYPNLMIENVSGGGNRLDLGMLRYSDVGWMDDRSAPSVHVRHNIEGLSALFPPAYLLSFVMDYGDEALHEASDVPLYFRSRMAAILGLCFRTSEFGDGELEAMAREVDIYKSIRATIRAGSGTLLTPQADARGGPAWDVFQTTAPGNGGAVVAAFQWDPGVREITFRPAGLRSRTIYDVRSVDVGLIGTSSGAELAAHGISIVQSPHTAAHIIVLQPQRRPE